MKEQAARHGRAAHPVGLLSVLKSPLASSPPSLLPRPSFPKPSSPSPRYHDCLADPRSLFASSLLACAACSLPLQQRATLNQEPVTRVASEQPPAKEAPGPPACVSFVLRDLTATTNLGEVTTPPATPPMTTRGSRATATGLVLTLIAVGAGVSSSGGFPLLLSFAGELAGSTLIFVSVQRAADDPTAATGRPGLLAAGVHCLRRNLGLAGLILASSAASATAAADRETAPVLCFCAFALLLLGLSLLNIGVLLVGEQEQ